jgi:hypothetical protein
VTRTISACDLSLFGQDKILPETMLVLAIAAMPQLAGMTLMADIF